MNVVSFLAGYGASEAVAGERECFDYAELSRRVARNAAAWGAAGIGPGSVVGLEIADEPGHLAAALALMHLGSVHVTLAHHDTQSVKSALLSRVRATHHLRDGEIVALEGQLTDLGAGVYLNTSGTTGDMNVVPFSVDQLRQQAARHSEYSNERLLRLAAIEHNNSKRHRLYCVFNGGTNVFRPNADFDVADYCRSQAVTCLDISRMHASDLAASGTMGRFDGVKLRTGGSAIPIDVRRAVEERVTPLLYVRYAATECGAIAMAHPGEHDDDESVGRPLPGVELEIVDAEGRPLPVGESGRVRLRAAGMATKYLDAPAQTAARFKDGWFWPGDLACLRPDGSLILLGRQDDMIILNGLNIFPGEIERVLERHPAVAVAAALSLPSPVHGQIPVAAVELRPGARATPLELQRFAREHLAMRSPRRVIIAPALPRNSQGKLLRRSMVDWFVRGSDRVHAEHH